MSIKGLIALGLVIACLLDCSYPNSKRVDEKTGQLGEKCIFYFNPDLQKNVYTKTDELPRYPGGAEELAKFISKNVHFDNNDLLQRSLIISIILAEDGRVISKEIFNKKKELSKEEKDVLMSIDDMPNWEPAKCNGNAVCFKMMIPINF